MKSSTIVNLNRTYCCGSVFSSGLCGICPLADFECRAAALRRGDRDIGFEQEDVTESDEDGSLNNWISLKSSQWNHLRVMYRVLLMRFVEVM